MRAFPVDIIILSLSAYVHVPPFIRCSILVCASPSFFLFPSYFLIFSPLPPAAPPSTPFSPEHAPVLSISPPCARAPFFPRHFIPSFSLHSLIVVTLPSFVVPHCPRSPLNPSLLTLAAHSERFPPISPSLSSCPFAPSLIYCITVHEVANLRRVILYKYVSQINIRATAICMHASLQLQVVDKSLSLSSLSLLSSGRLFRRGIQCVRLAIPRIEADKPIFDNETRVQVAAHTDPVYLRLFNKRVRRGSHCTCCLMFVKLNRNILIP